MEESPHKCPVCSRSFNQRSNLKTHLLTHTDHKPYECSACGKVFRRNCDLRRHALTHAVGDVPAEVLDVGDDERILSDEEDTVLEVDSPIQSPVTRSRSPSLSAVARAETPENDNDEPDRPTETEPESDSKGLYEPPEITHCHHDGGQTHYTMRPHNEYAQHMLPSPYSMLRHMSQHMAKPQDSFVPMLHVRRDLHHKNPSSPPSNSSSSTPLLEPGPGFLSSIPIRKRPIGIDGEPHLMISRPFANHSSSQSLGHPLNLSGQPSLQNKQLEDLLPQPSIPKENSRDLLPASIPPVPTVPPIPPILNHMNQMPSIGLSVPGNSIGIAPQQQQLLLMPPTMPQNQSSMEMLKQPSQQTKQLQAPQPPVAPPPKRTGFSIEDIMRR